MQRREQYLLGGLVAAVIIWQMSGVVYSVVFGPFQVRSDELSRLSDSVSKKNDEMLQRARASKQLSEWRANSLPPDENAKSNQPSALDAQRLYLEWVTNLAHLCGWEAVKVTPGTVTKKGNIYFSVLVKVEADMRYEQLVRFLDLFNRTQLLHRISLLQISAKSPDSDQILHVTFDAEGLALLDVKPRRTIFPRTRLAAALDESSSSLVVTNVTDFPTKDEFYIQIKNEILKVTSTKGTTWSIERGIERTTAAAYSEGTLIEQIKLGPQAQERSLEELRNLVAANIFMKPAPPYRMRLSPPGEKSLTRGKSLDFSLTATGFDPAQGKPEFELEGTAPPGLKLERSGKMTWKPGDDVSAGKYDVRFIARHPSAPQGQIADTVAIRLKEPKPALKLANDKPPKVFLNREWKFRPELPGLNSGANASTVLSWRLGDRPPAGMRVDSRTGEVTWTPDDAVPFGELTIQLIVTDTDQPPQSTTFPLKLEVADDAAQFTRLTGVFEIGAKKRALLIDQSRNVNSELDEGESFAISDIKGKVEKINSQSVVVMVNQKSIHWGLGDSLREALAKSEGPTANSEK